MAAGIALPKPVLQAIDDAVLCWLASVSADGAPNVSPKELFTAHGDEAVLIAEIASPVSRGNVQATGRACLSFVDVFAQKGFKIEGAARYLAKTDAAFGGLAAPLLAAAGSTFPVHGLFHITPTRITPIIAPSYRLFPDRTADEMRAQSYATYGVKPVAG